MCATLVVGDGECAARAGIEQLAAQLLAHRDETLVPEEAVDVHRPRDVDQSVLRQNDDVCAARLVEGDQIAGDGVDVAEVP